MAMIRDHVWRPPNCTARNESPREDRPCEYMNCRRPRAEHAWARSGARR